MIKPGKHVVLVISDTQCPFQHQDTVPFLQYVADKFQPDEVVHIGDEVDFHGLSRFFRDPDGYSAGHELKFAVRELKKLYKVFPEVKVCTSNHTNRPYDRAFEVGIPRSFLHDINDVLEAPKGWKWAEQWTIDGVAYVHGHHGPGGQSSIQRNAIGGATSIVFGHVHAHAGIYYYATKEDLRFAFNVGCLIDNNAYAFVYGKKYVCKPIIGCGIVYKGVPQFIPMLLNKRGRWIRG